MTRLSWTNGNERLFETGLDRGVLYLKDGTAVVWNGLTSVDETGAESAVSYYLDGRPYLYFPQPKEYEATLSAYTYPDEFASVMGLEEVDVEGFYLDSQLSDSFNFSYRTLIGNATEGTDAGYKIHLVYNATVVPQDVTYETLSDNISPSDFSWQINAVPVNVEGFRPTAHIVINTRNMSAENLAQIEDILYGTSTTPASMPEPHTILETLRYGDTIVIVDNGDGTWTATGAEANLHDLTPDLIQIDNVLASYNGDGTFNIASTDEDDTGLIDVQTPSLAASTRVENNSVTSAEIVGGNVFLETEGGTVYNLGTVGALPDESDGLDPEVIVNISSIDTPSYVSAIPEWFSISGTNTLLATPASPPVTGSAQASAWSPDGVYLAIGNSGTPFLNVYKRSGDTLTKIANPATLPPSTVVGLAWSNDGQYLAVAHALTPFVTIYKRAGDVLTKLADPALLPASTGNSVAWTPDDQYLAVAHTTTPFVTVYKKAGDVFTKVANPATLPLGNGMGVGWSPDGAYLAVAHITTSPFLTIYKRSGDVLTKLANPAAPPAGAAQSALWSPTGRYLAVSHAVSPFFTVYRRDGDVFTKLANPTILPAGNALEASWSPDERFLAVVGSSAPYVNVYKLTADTLIPMPNVQTLGASTTTYTFKWSRDGRYVILTQSTSPYMSVYKTTGQPPAGNPTRLALAP